MIEVHEADDPHGEVMPLYERIDTGTIAVVESVALQAVVGHEHAWHVEGKKMVCDCGARWRYGRIEEPGEERSVEEMFPFDPVSAVQHVALHDRGGAVLPRTRGARRAERRAEATRPAEDQTPAGGVDRG